MTRLLALVAAALIFASAAYSGDQSTETADKAAAEKKVAAKNADAQAANDKAIAEQKAAEKKKIEDEDPDKVDWSKVDWRKRLTRAQYNVLRQAGTERPFRNKYWNKFDDGQYRCAGCGLPLFESTAKFESECGWPSFDKAASKDAISEHEDLTLFQPRVEIRCKRCGSHLGHVFNDGPTETGQRYCLNSVAMKFVPSKELEKQKEEAAAKEVKEEKKEKEAEPAAKKDEAAAVETEKESPKK